MKIQFPGTPYERKNEPLRGTAPAGRVVSTRSRRFSSVELSPATTEALPGEKVSRYEYILSRLHYIESMYRSAAGALIGEGGTQRAGNILSMLDNLLSQESSEEMKAFSPSKRGLDANSLSPEVINSTLTEITSYRNSLIVSLREEMKRHRLEKIKQEVTEINRGAAEVSVRDVEAFQKLIRSTYEKVSRGEALKAVSLSKEKVSRILNG